MHNSDKTRIVNEILEYEILFDAYNKSQDPRDLIITEEIIRKIAEYETMKAELAKNRNRD